MVQQIAQQTATLATATQTPSPEPVVPATDPPAAGGIDVVTPTQTTTARVSQVQATVPSDTPSPVARGPTLGATAGDPVRETVTAPSPTLSTVVAAEDPTLHTERARVRENLAEFRKYNPPVFEGEI